MIKSSVENRAIEFVLEYEKSKSREPEDVSRGRLFHGFDIISRNNTGEIVRLIEVKGSTKKQSIPDAYETEFSRDLKLIATHLYLVGSIEKEPILYIIPREKIKKEHLKPKLGFRFSSTFQTKILPKCIVSYK